MSSLPGWVLDSELEAHFISGDKHEMAHTYYEPESLSQRRPTERLERWQQERKIGAGGFGKVLLESCTKGRARSYDACVMRLRLDYYPVFSTLLSALQFIELQKGLILEMRGPRADVSMFTNVS